MIHKRVLYAGKIVVVSCDERCHKAWGINTRPTGPAGQHIPDTELGVAPIDPGTAAGHFRKPVSRQDRLNRWCVMECERSKTWEVFEPESIKIAIGSG